MTGRWRNTEMWGRGDVVGGQEGQSLATVSVDPRAALSLSVGPLGRDGGGTIKVCNAAVYRSNNSKTCVCQKEKFRPTKI